jgi:outer membrane lipoprotein carrier protein
MDIHAIAQAVDAHYNHLRTLQAEFSETYRMNGIDRTESGTLWLKKPGKMLFLSDGQSAWFYLPRERQVRKTPVKQLDDLRSPLGLLLGKTRLEKELQPLSFAPDIPLLTPGDVVLRGVPRGLAEGINEVILEVTADSRIVRIIVNTADGSETEYRFSDEKENVAIADQRFRFTAPPGVEVMGAESGQ